MPCHCFVPGCRSNYRHSEVRTSVFKFPKDEIRRQAWLDSINRLDLDASLFSKVCIKHFEEKFIVREHRAVRPDGTELVLPRATLGLTKDAVPTIFDKPYPPPKRKAQPKETPSGEKGRKGNKKRMPPLKRRKELTVFEKANLIRLVEKRGLRSLRAVAEEYDMPVTQLNHIMRKRTKKEILMEEQQALAAAADPLTSEEAGEDLNETSPDSPSPYVEQDRAKNNETSQDGQLTDIYIKEEPEAGEEYDVEEEWNPIEPKMEIKEEPKDMEEEGYNMEDDYSNEDEEDIDEDYEEPEIEPDKLVNETVLVDDCNDNGLYEDTKMQCPNCSEYSSFQSGKFIKESPMPYPSKIHLPAEAPVSEKTMRSMRKRCKVCIRNGKRVDTLFTCDTCPSRPGLCLGCFRAYHNYGPLPPGIKCYRRRRTKNYQHSRLKKPVPVATHFLLRSLLPESPEPEESTEYQEDKQEEVKVAPISEAEETDLAIQAIMFENQDNQFE